MTNLNRPSQRILLVGGGTYLGINITSALLAEGVDVSLIIRDDHVQRLGMLASRVNWSVADVWDMADLKGRARGHTTVIHTVGSMVQDAARGLTYERLNVTSARHVANMCVSDGVQHFVLLSASRAPWINRHYIRSKREAERYVKRVGIKTSIIRAPLTYVRGANRPALYRLLTVLGQNPLLSRTPIGQVAPMPVDVFARGIARIALNVPARTSLYHAHQLRQLNNRAERRGQAPDALSALDDTDTPFTALDDNTPFGWSPSERD